MRLLWKLILALWKRIRREGRVVVEHVLLCYMCHIVKVCIAKSYAL